MTVTTNGQATASEPETFTRTRPEQPGWVKSWRKYRARPGWQQAMLALGAVGAVSYGSWKYVGGPIIEHRVAAALAAEDVPAQVQDVFDQDSEAFTAGVLARVDDRIRSAQNGLPPVVVQKADLQAILSCPLTAEAKRMIGADANDPTKTSLDPTNAGQVASSVQQARAAGAPDPQMRITDVSGALRITTDATLGARLVDCSSAVARPTPTTAPATAVTPPPNAN